MWHIYSCDGVGNDDGVSVLFCFIYFLNYSRLFNCSVVDCDCVSIFLVFCECFEAVQYMWNN